MNNALKEIPATIKAHPQIAVGFAAFSLLGLGMFAYYFRKRRTLRYARKWVGEKEISGNMGFENEKFEKLMREYGDFRDTQAWCMSFAKMVWMQKMGNKYDQLLNKLITPSTQTTWVNFEKDDSGLFELNKEAKPGDIVIWQKYKNGTSTWQGHAGIVKKAGKNNFESIEGNTNAQGGREGIEVAIKERKYNFDTTNGLRLKGFIHQKITLRK